MIIPDDMERLIVDILPMMKWSLNFEQTELIASHENLIVNIAASGRVCVRSNDDVLFDFVDARVSTLFYNEFLPRRGWRKRADSGKWMKLPDIYKFFTEQEAYQQEMRDRGKL